MSELIEQAAVSEISRDLIQDYPEALVRIAALRTGKVHHLIFGWIELYPFDMKPPKGWTAGDKPWPIPGQKNSTCSFSATKVLTSVALNWYAHAANGNINIALSSPRPVPAQSIALAPEPAFGHFLTPVEAPFVFRWHDAPRIHRLVPLKRPPGALCRLQKNERARDWLKQNLGFDPFSFDEWLGGIALLAPNPICAAIEVFPSERSTGGQETISLYVVPRRTPKRVAALTSLTVHIAEKRNEAWASVKTVAVNQTGYSIVSFPQPTAKVGYTVICSQRGLLRFVEPCDWLDQTHMSFSIGQQTIVVEVPSGGRRKPPDRYKITSRISAGEAIVGRPVYDRGRDRLFKLKLRRKTRETRLSAAQRVFGIIASESTAAEIESKRTEAEEFIIGLVSNARHRVVFVDPFFGVRELRQFALRNPNTNVTPRILTGLPALKVDVGSVPGFLHQQGSVLVADLKTSKATLGSLTPVIRIMPGQDTPVIHDRYLVTDQDVWHCGPSFNELGKRLGVIVRLPNPLPIRRLIAKVWLKSQPIEDLWSAAHVKSGTTE